MLRRVKFSTLVAICGGGGLALAGMATLLNKESDKLASQAPFVKTALDMIEKEPEVLEMVGQPYALGKPQVMDLWLGKLDANNVKVRVPMKGSNDTAFIYAFARKKERKDKLKLFKIEMTFNKIKGKKMVLFDVEDKGLEHDVAPPEPASSAKQTNGKKTSPIPEGMIPERDPNAPRRIPKAILRNRKPKSDSPDAAKATATDTDTASTDSDKKHDSSSDNQEQKTTSQ